MDPHKRSVTAMSLLGKRRSEHSLGRRHGRATGTRLHDMRRYYASRLIRQGALVQVVQARLGHANAKETPPARVGMHKVGELDA